MNSSVERERDRRNCRDEEREREREFLEDKNSIIYDPSNYTTESVLASAIRIIYIYIYMHIHIMCAIREVTI